MSLQLDQYTMNSSMSKVYFFKRLKLLRMHMIMFGVCSPCLEMSMANVRIDVFEFFTAPHSYF